jgi:phage baseplate assembly protein W
MAVNKTFSLSYPVEDDNISSTLKVNLTTKEQLKSKLFLLLTTDEGTRYYRRDYGTRLKYMLFEQNDNISFDTIKQEIKVKSEKFIPELTILSITNEQVESRLIINIIFQYKSTKEIDELSLSFSGSI